MLYLMTPAPGTDPANPNANPQANRRRGGRIRCPDFRCDLGPILDLSSTGLRLTTRSRAKVGDIVPLVFTTPDGPVVLQARIVRKASLGFLKSELGLQFISPTQDQLQRLSSMARGIAICDTGRWSRGV